MVATSGYDGPVIDPVVHHHWTSQLDVTDHMSAGWREHLGIPGSLPGGAGAMPILPATPYRRPGGDYLPGVDAPGSPAGSDIARTREDVFGTGRVERAVLAYDRGMFIPSVPNVHRAIALSRAMNDWTIESWFASDERFSGLIIVPNQTPHAAADEIRRSGENDRMVGVLMAANGLSRPFGHAAYHDIYAAAVDLDLPIVIHAGGDVNADTLSHPTAGGLPATFGEVATLSYSAVMTHVQSMIVQGVFERFPSLRVFIAGAGAAWIPGLFFRLDVNWRGLRREVPWVRRMPSEYFRDHFRVSMWPLDRAPDADGAERIVQALRTFDGIEELLCFSSGYPHWNADDIDDVAAHIPAEWHRGVFSDNARSWFRWADRPRAAARKPEVAVGAMPETGELGDPNRRSYDTEDGREIEWVPAMD